MSRAVTFILNLIYIFLPAFFLLFFCIVVTRILAFVFLLFGQTAAAAATEWPLLQLTVLDSNGCGWLLLLAVVRRRRWRLLQRLYRRLAWLLIDFRVFERSKNLGEGPATNIIYQKGIKKGN